MKCTNCGKNNAVGHYHYEVNGQVYEAHLCADCARKLSPEREFAARSREMFGSMFPESVFGGGLFGEGLFGGLMGLPGFIDRRPARSLSLWDLMSPFAAFGMPRVEISFPEAGSAPGEEKGEVDPELSRRREMNALREQMKTAAESEDYEKAAQLRDKLRAMENESK